MNELNNKIQNILNQFRRQINSHTDKVDIEVLVKSINSCSPEKVYLYEKNVDSYFGNYQNYEEEQLFYLLNALIERKKNA